MTETSNQGNFATMGTKAGTDKIHTHAYHRFYPHFIEKYREMDNFSLLEIGVQEGYSLDFWKEYFPKAFIYGLDIGKEAEGDKYKVFKGDQSDINSLDYVMYNIDTKHNIHFIIDDGSHIPEHQLLTFNRFFEHLLKPGGCYIIEDIETSYWTKNNIYGYPTQYGYYHEKSVVENFKKLADDINHLFLNEDAKNIQDNIQHSFSTNVRKMVSMITFAENCIIILKKTEEEMNYSRTYNFLGNL